MEVSWTSRKLFLLATLLGLVLLLAIVTGASLARKRSSRSRGAFGGAYDITWASDHVRVHADGRVVELALDQSSGAGFGSKDRYLFGYLTMQIRLVPNNSAGTAVAYYVSSLTDDRDELSFVFMGNSTGHPYSLLTNVWVNGVGAREQRLLLWFDPSQAFHSYSLLWNQYQIVFLVDSVPIRVFRNVVATGYPSSKPMGVYTSIWNAVGNAMDWTNAPFVVAYTGLESSDASRCGGEDGGCSPPAGHWWASLRWPWQPYQESNLTWVRRNCVVFDYCTASEPPPPFECQQQQ